MIPRNANLLVSPAPHRGDGELDELRAAAECELKHLSFLGHDLGNNLNAITLLLSLLEKRLARSREFADELEMLDRVRQSIDHTTDGIQRLLAYARLGRGRPRPLPGPVSLLDAAAGVASLYYRKAKAKGLTIAVEVPPDAVVLADRDLLALVLQNLVGNAVKYSTGGTVRVAARRAGGGHGDGDVGPWVVSVLDQGPGIAPQRVGRLFEQFERGETHGQDGAGLGLAIAAEAVEAMGANLSVESQVGIGSTFHVAIPCPLAAGQAETTQGDFRWA